MAFSPKIQTTKKIIPMIYAYSTPEIERHRGWIKIGYTEQEVSKRLEQQMHTADVKWILEWKGNATYDDGSGETFKDTEFHEYLKRKGIKRQSENRNEWFFISKEESLRLFNEFRMNRGKDDAPSIIQYALRNEQNEAVERALDYFHLNPEGEFLWNAKPRFGKTLSVYDLCKRLNAINVLVVTNRPAIANSWYDDYCKFLGKESGYVFISEIDALRNKQYAISEETYNDLKSKDPAIKSIEFLSLQDLKGSIYFGGKFEKLKHIRDTKWNLLVIDEAHEGVDTFKTDVAFDHIERKYTLHLSGTPFKAIANNKFPEKAIYNWTYADEQKAKRDWIGVPGTQNPYEKLPTLCMFTYQMSEIIQDKVEQGITLEGGLEEYAFDLNEFFRTDNSGKFAHNDAVNVFLDALATQDKYPFSTETLRNELRHTLWLLNRVDSARALARKLKEHPIFRKYGIVLAAGDGGIYDVKENEKALDRVKDAIEHNDRTITISVGQLTTGVTVPEWSAVLMLSNISSPSLYMQAAFRAQNPYTFKSGTEFRRKDTAYVFDFDPARTLEIYEKFANDLSPLSEDLSTRKNNVRELLNFFPVIGEDDKGKMIELDAELVLSIPRTLRSKEVVRSGFMSNFLFQNISNVFGAPEAVIDIIKNFQETKNTGPITRGKALYVDENGNVQIPEDKVIGTAVGLFGDKIYYNPNEFDEILENAGQKLEPSEEEQQIKKLVEKFSVEVTEPMLKTAKERFGDNLTISAQKALTRTINSSVETEVKKAITEHQIHQKTLDSEMNKEIDEVSTIKERNEIVHKYKEKKAAATEDFKKSLDGKMDELIRSAGGEIVKRVQTDQVKKEISNVEDKVRNHLRGFTRTIPSFLMAYGAGNDVTLATFDQIIPGKVFKEVTSITLQEFRLLRDGGSIINADGVKEFYTGGLFDEVVFDDSVKEFMALKKKLANYFDESSEEDIFDYIPPQKTNQIFTPKKVVMEMVDRLEGENPGCFDDETKTFADLYMKSGLYLAEIVKRLYRSKRMKILFPDETDRLAHIFSKQIYGLAPTEIIYRICRSFLLGFSDTVHIEADNIRLYDPMKFKGDDLEPKLQEIFSKGAEEIAMDHGEITDEPHIVVGETAPQKADQTYTVTTRVEAVPQPRGGYINPKSMEKTTFDDGITLYNESIAPSTMGMVVDYMTRFDQGAPIRDAFHVSILGAAQCNRSEEAEEYISQIKGLDDDSILNACKLVWFDQVFRTGNVGFGDPNDAVPDHETCENVRTMIKRAATFFRQFGPIIIDGPTFMGGYSGIVTRGDGDFVTKNTIWDFKVSKNEPNSKHTLQVAMYYLMAHRSVIPEYKELTKIGIFNPRLNTAYVLDMRAVPEPVIRTIEKDVIGY